MSYSEHVALIYGQTGQTIEFYPPTEVLVVEGRPTTGASFQVFDWGTPDTGTAKLSGTATLDAVSTTTDAAAGSSQTLRRKLPVASTASIALFRRYLLTDATTGKRAVVLPAEVVSNDYISLVTELAWDFATSSTLHGLRHVISVDATFLQTEANINEHLPYRVIWTYSVASIPRRHVTTFDLVRRKFSHGVTIERLLQEHPDATHWETVDGRGQSLTGELQAAEAQVQLDIRLRGNPQDEHAFADPLIRDALILKAWIWKLAKRGARPLQTTWSEWEDVANRDYQTTLSRALDVSGKAVQSNPSGSLGTRPKGFDFKR